MINKEIKVKGVSSVPILIFIAVIGLLFTGILGHQAIQEKENCTVSLPRPCYDKQVGNKIIGLEPKGGENALKACLKNAAPNNFGESTTKTPLCEEEKYQYCYEGKSQVSIREFKGDCKLIPPPAPANKPPVISEVKGPTVLNVNETGIWVVNASDPENGALSYAVDWGDRATLSSQTATFGHAYSTAGTYTIKFTVTDDKGLSVQRSIMVTVTIENKPPVISEINGPTVLNVNETGTWVVNASDPENGALSYTVEWGNQDKLSSQIATFKYTYFTAGTYTIKFTVTDDMGLTAGKSITVTVNRPNLPDLVVSHTSLTHTYANTPNALSPHFSNIGYDLAPKNFVIRVYIDNSLIGERTYSADVLAGSMGVVGLNYTFTTTGSHQIKTVVDATNLVTEINETNNELIYTVNITAPTPKLPDLIVNHTSLAYTYSNFSNRFYLHFSNIGYDLAPKNFVVRVYVDDSFAGEITYSSDLWANSMGVASLNYTFTTPGSHQIKTVVDATNLVTEINETNNELIYTVNITAPPSTLPDLVVSHISITNTYANTLNRISPHFMNIGYSVAPKNFVIRVYVDDNLISELTYTSDVPIGGMGVVGLDYTFTTTGSHQIKTVVDATNLVAESNETNNELVYTVNIL